MSRLADTSRKRTRFLPLSRSDLILSFGALICSASSIRHQILRLFHWEFVSYHQSMTVKTFSWRIKNFRWCSGIWLWVVINSGQSRWMHIPRSRCTRMRTTEDGFLPSDSHALLKSFVRGAAMKIRIWRKLRKATAVGVTIRSSFGLSFSRVSCRLTRAFGYL